MTKKIYQWDEIKEDFEDATLILGNGASRNVSENFSYDSLKDEAEKQNLLNADVMKLFKTFNTTDFELILRTLWHAYLVNTDLEIEDNKSTEAYKSISSALVTLVRHVHSEYENINFKNIGEFIGKFSVIFPLSYDLIVYWTILYLNENDKNNFFKDCFASGGRFRGNFFSSFYSDGNKKTRIVAYPHGMLALNVNRFGSEIKVSRREGENSFNLLTEILQRWEQHNYSPVFVSEGTSAKKIETIERSIYLNTVHKEFLPKALKSHPGNFRKNHKNLAIFGWALGEQDKHIIEALLSNLKNDDLDGMKIAISVSPNSTQDELTALKLKIKSFFKTKKYENYKYINEDIKNLEIKFFSRASLPSWRNS